MPKKTKKAFLFEVQARRSYGLSEMCQDTVLGVITYFREHVLALGLQRHTRIITLPTCSFLAGIEMRGI